MNALELVISIHIIMAAFTVVLVTWDFVYFFKGKIMTNFVLIPSQTQLLKGKIMNALKHILTAIIGFALALVTVMVVVQVFDKLNQADVAMQMLSQQQLHVAKANEKVLMLAAATEQLIGENKALQYKNDVLRLQNETLVKQRQEVAAQLRIEQAKGPVDKFMEEPAVVATVKAAEQAGDRVHESYHKAEAVAVASAARVADWWANNVQFKW